MNVEGGLIQLTEHGLLLNIAFEGTPQTIKKSIKTGKQNGLVFFFPPHFRSFFLLSEVNIFHRTTLTECKQMEKVQCQE